MGGLSLWHWLVVVIIVLLLFGKGRISDMMGDLGKGLKSFKQGMAEDEENKSSRPAEQPRQLPRDQQQPIDITPSAPPPSQPAPPAAAPGPGDEPPRS